jgi:hypothetical protein
MTKQNGMRFYFEVLSLYCLSNETMYKTLRTVATVATLTRYRNTYFSAVPPYEKKLEKFRNVEVFFT